MFGLKPDVNLNMPGKYFTLEDYESAEAKWCPGCGDHGVLSAVQKLCREFQLVPENTVCVSGIGCSSRFPHYMKTYGFHGLHGRALPVASGIKFRRPDLHVFVATGDGDCCSIGAGHWVHAIRYNMNMVVMLFDNEIYGLTKNQASATSRKGTKSNTTPRGSILPPLNPIQTTLGIANASFVAQTVDSNAPHLYATLKAAYEHQGLSFIRIIQRCPVFQAQLVDEITSKRELFTLMTHENGITIDENIAKVYENQVTHDPSDIDKGRKFAGDDDTIHIGLFYQNKDAEKYDDYGAHNMGFSADEKENAINDVIDRYAV